MAVAVKLSPLIIFKDAMQHGVPSRVDSEWRSLAVPATWYSMPEFYIDGEARGIQVIL